MAAGRLLVNSKPLSLPKDTCEQMVKVSPKAAEGRGGERKEEFSLVSSHCLSRKTAVSGLGNIKSPGASLKFWDSHTKVKGRTLKRNLYPVVQQRNFSIYRQKSS